MMKNQDYIPRPQTQFHVWQAVLIAVIEAHATAWGIPVERIARAKVFQAAWETAYAKASKRQDRSTTDVHAKDDAYEAYVKDIRNLVSEYLRFNSKVTDTDRTSMGLTISKGQRTPSPIPGTYPLADIDISTPLQHTIYIADNDVNAKGKPAGAHGCEIWVKIGADEPKTLSEYIFLAIDTKGRYIVKFDITDVGKRIWYRFRWVNNLGQPGPWSNTYTKVVGG
jgi:hypothetical protein